MKNSVNIYWDNSNIFIGAKHAAWKKDEGFFQTSIRIQFDALLNLARAGRDLASAVCMGSIPPELRDVWDRVRDLGVHVELYERGAGSGREQGIDQCLQVHMLRAVLDAQTPQTAVLLTGDGHGYEEGAGFFADLERMAKKGWGVEVLSWDGSCKVAFKKWARSVGVYIPLEDYYEAVTFIEGGRQSSSLSLVHRQTARPEATE